MPADNLQTRYARLDAKSRHVLQLCALSDETLNRRDLADLSSKSGWTALVHRVSITRLGGIR